MRTDRELIESAAKAVGVDGTWQNGWFPGLVGSGVGDIDVPWNPLANDGQALRLAVRLQIVVGKYDDYANAGPLGSDVDVVVWGHEEKDPCAAVRLAIVRAAAEIGAQSTAQPPALPGN